MKTILVDAIHCFVSKEGEIFKEMHDLLESYPNQKIVLTGANDEQFKQFKLDQVPYEVFTLKHDPEKTDPEYYKTLLSRFDLVPENIIYFEHDEKAVENARSIGIISYFYDDKVKDLDSLKSFIDGNL